MDLKVSKKRSQAKKINLLMKKYEKTMKSYLDLAEFKEPVLMLMRNNRRVEFYEGATKGGFEFQHSNGKTLDIDLEPQYLNTFDYGKKTFKGYICHEDVPTPLPVDPIVTAEMFNIAQEKTLHDLRKLKETEHMKIGLKWKQILIGLAILVAVPLGAKIIGGLFGVDIDLWPFGKEAASTVVQTPSAPVDTGTVVIP